MASRNNPKSVEQLIRQHSKARVIYRTPVSVIDAKVRGMRYLCDRDVIEGMVRKYA